MNWRQIGKWLLIAAVLAGAIFGATIVWFTVWHFILAVTGVSPASTRWGVGWAGFLSAGVISTGIFTGIYREFKDHQCHNELCWPEFKPKWWRRIAHHTTANGHRLCKVCIGLPNEESVMKLHDIHDDHK